MRRSKQWAAVRTKAPKPEWEYSDVDASDRDFFERLSAQHGTAFARRMWHHLEDLDTIMRETEGDEIIQADDIRRFGEQLATRDQVEALAFAEVMKTYRIVSGGTARRRFARIARRQA
jgi:hypothetical protein